MSLIPVTKKGNSKFRGMADERQIKESNGVLIPLDLAKFAAEAAAIDEKEAEKAAEAEKKAAAEADKKTSASPSDVKRGPGKAD